MAFKSFQPIPLQVDVKSIVKEGLETNKTEGSEEEEDKFVKLNSMEIKPVGIP